MNDLLTTKQVQEYLQIDRTTVYRMLKDGRLTGVKIGQQWRFPREDVEGFLSTHVAEPASSAIVEPGGAVVSMDILPLHRIQPVQDVFAEMARVGAVTTSPNGETLTRISNLCPFCKQILSTKSGRQACVESWRNLAEQPEEAPRFVSCHAGLQYARARIRLDNEFIAMLIAGQFYAYPPDAAEEKHRIEGLSETHNLDYETLATSAQSLPVLEEWVQSQIVEWLEKVSRTFEEVGRERADLMDRLQRIAAISGALDYKP